jgi:hypothetical protein
VTEPCKECLGDKHGHWNYGLQIQLKNCSPAAQHDCPCPLFDYEYGSGFGGSGNLPNDLQSIDTGYCSIQAVEGVIFKLCDCDSIDEMSTAGTYAIRLTIMTPATGVYWTTVNPQRVSKVIGGGSYGCDWSDDPRVHAPCTPTSVDPIRVGAYPDPSLNGDNYCLEPCDASSYRMSLEYSEVPSTNQRLYDPTNLTDEEKAKCCFTCGNNRVKAIQTCYASFMQEAKPVLLIDMPTMVYDPNDMNVALDKTVSVKVEIIEMPKNGDICLGDCKVLCDCLVKVGDFAKCATAQCNLCIPYLAMGSGWWTGIAFTNYGEKAAELAVTFYTAGSSATATVNAAAQSVTPVNVADLLSDLGLPTDQPLYAKVKGGGQIQAFVTVAYGLELAQGYMAPFAILGQCGCGHCAGVPDIDNNGYNPLMITDGDTLNNLPVKP